MKTVCKLQLLFVLFCCILTSAQEKQVAPLNAPFAGATITDFKGKVSIQLPSQSLSAPSRGEVLPAETLISTQDGRMLLRLADGSDVLVRPNTRLLVKQPESGNWRYIQLLIGRVRAEIQKRLGGSPGFQIGTPSAVISVRGTVFEVEVNRLGFTEVDVHEGVVQLDSAKGMGESVLVRAGFSSRVGFESGPETPRPTRDMRPELERPGRHDDRHSDHDEDSLKRIEASSGDHHDGSDSQHETSGSSSGSSGSGDLSGSDTKDTGADDHGGHSDSGSHPPEF
ncbi:MAG TPA: FecR family protein [Candidatus Limnocylindrales bacterium]|nr:FecR family protein [Candidatus Limnocylindrales bacterium]